MSGLELNQIFVGYLVTLTPAAADIGHLLPFEIGFEKVELFLCDGLRFGCQVVTTTVAETLVVSHGLPVHFGL